MRFVKVCFLLVTVILSQSCSKNNMVTKAKLPHKSTSYLIEQMQANELQCDWFSAKLDIAFKTDKMSDSFKMHARIRKDSAIWLSATYYAVEAARFLITEDTVKFMDRKNNKYFVGDFDYINEKFDVELDFESLQALILGNSAGIAEQEKIKSYPSSGLYHLSSIGKRKLKRASEKDPEKLKTDVALDVSLYPESYKVARLFLQDFKQNKSMTSVYDKYQKIDNQLVPEKTQLSIVADQNVNATIEYLKVTLNKPLKFSFSIPEKYEKLEY